MKILWVKCDFLHPTNKGGQIRSLEMLRRLHRDHEIHYAAFADPTQPEGPRRASEYCSHVYPLPLELPAKSSPAFAAEVLRNLFSPLPLAIARYVSSDMRMLIEKLLLQGAFDRVVCDFLAAAPNVPQIENSVLFQHNIETMLWRRHASTASDPLRRAYFGRQATRMFAFERDTCRRAGHVVAVSAKDREDMQGLFNVSRISAIPTGVDVDHFAPPPGVSPVADLVFIGSMDWLPNIDGMSWFVEDILPLIRRQRKDCRLAIAGRKPSGKIMALAEKHSEIQVTGSVPDIRPYLWGATVSIVPLRIGGGTRLKIYESMAARIPVVSTTVGAEGLEIHPSEDIRIADTPEAFAAQCIELLDNEKQRRRQAAAAWEMVNARFSWSHVTREFEQILQTTHRPSF
jgi:glycosyltransferase involved in cell wall biosynthesis